MTEEEFTDLVEASLAGRLDVEGTARLNAALHGDLARQRAFISQVRIHAMLTKCAERSVSAARPARSSRRAWRVAAAIAILLAGIGLAAGLAVGVWRKTADTSPSVPIGEAPPLPNTEPQSSSNCLIVNTPEGETMKTNQMLVTLAATTALAAGTNVSAVLAGEAKSSVTVTEEVAPAAEPDYATALRSIPLSVTGYTGTTAVMNFPVLVRLSQKGVSGFFYGEMEYPETGADLRFGIKTDTGIEPLDFDIDTWNTNGESLVWVRVPNLTNGFTFAAYYGFTNAPAVRLSGTNVWRAYEGVWHLSSTNDASPQANHATDVGSHTKLTHPGVIGNCLTNASTTIQDANAHFVAPFSPARMTDNGKVCFSIWLNSDRDTSHLSTGGQRLFTRQPRNFNGDNVEVGFEPNRSTSNGGTDIFARSFKLNQENGKSATHYLPARKVFTIYPSWTLISVQFDGTTVTFYTNGVLAVATASVVAQAVPYLSTDVGIGNYNSNWSTAGISAVLGALDEARIFDGVVTADRVKADADTVLNSAFLTVGAVESALPIIVSSDAQGITASSATAKASLIANGSSAADIFIAWGDDPDALSVTQQIATAVSGASEFSTPLTGLARNRYYYYRHFAVNTAGMSKSPVAAVFLTAFSGYTYWMGGNGNWTIDGHWTDGYPKNTDTIAYITNTCSATAVATPPTFGSLLVGGPANATSHANATLSFGPDAALKAGYLGVRYGSVFAIDGGALAVSSQMCVGGGAGSSDSGNSIATLNCTNVTASTVRIGLNSSGNTLVIGPGAVAKVTGGEELYIGVADGTSNVTDNHLRIEAGASLSLGGALFIGSRDREDVANGGASATFSGNTLEMDSAKLNVSGNFASSHDNGSLNDLILRHSYMYAPTFYFGRSGGTNSICMTDNSAIDTGSILFATGGGHENEIYVENSELRVSNSILMTGNTASGAFGNTITCAGTNSLVKVATLAATNSAPVLKFVLNESDYNRIPIEVSGTAYVDETTRLVFDTTGFTSNMTRTFTVLTAAKGIVGTILPKYVESVTSKGHPWQVTLRQSDTTFDVTFRHVGTTLILR